MLARIKAEPALVSGFIAAALALVTAFGFDLSADQVAAIMGVTAAVLALFVRSQVTPAANVVAQLTPAGAVVAGPASDTVDGEPVDVIPVDVAHDF